MCRHFSKNWNALYPPMCAPTCLSHAACSLACSAWATQVLKALPWSTLTKEKRARASANFSRLLAATASRQPPKVMSRFLPLQNIIALLSFSDSSYLVMVKSYHRSRAAPLALATK